jgi:CopG family nickel-responsive transcriptional regulator
MKKEKVERIGVSLSPKLLKKLDKVIKRIGYRSRSQAIQDAIREYMLKNELKIGRGMRIGIISLVYAHHIRRITDRLTKIQHGYYNMIKSSLHIHLDKDNCMELLILEGDAKKIKEVRYKLMSVPGVKYSDLKITKVVSY